MPSGGEVFWQVERGDRRLRFAKNSKLAIFVDSRESLIPKRRREPAWKLVIGLENSEAVMTEARNVTVRAAGFLVPPEFPGLSSMTGGYLCAYLDAWKVSLRMERRIRPLDRSTCDSLVTKLGIARGKLDLKSGRKALNSLVGPEDPAMDPRLRHVLDNILSTGRLQDLATEAGLSPQRIRALISTTLGVPPVRLRHWARLTRAIEVLDQGLTAAALHGGFADQPHFTRIARRLLGSPPGAVF